MSNTQRIISFVCATVLTVGGAVQVFNALSAEVISFAAVGFAMITFVSGLTWFYSDFIKATPNNERN